MKFLTLDKADFPLIGIVALFTLIRLAVAPTFGLGVDEAHYILYAKYLDLSYVDHPPLVGWVHAPLYYLFGTNEFLVRLPAILLFAIASVYCYRFTISFSGSRRIALWAVLAINSSFIMNAMSLMLLPDCFLLVLIFPLMAIILKMEETGQIKYYLYLGLILGLAGLAKYTAILFIVPLFVYFIIKKRFDLLLSPSMFIAAVIAFIMISPVIHWNYHHNWISFRYQGGHVLGTSDASVKSFLVSLLAQFGAYSPFLFIIAFYGFIKSFRAKLDQIRLAFLFGATVLLFFFYSSLYERTLPHWPSLFYLLFIPIGIYYLLSAASRGKHYYQYFAVGFSLVVTLFLYAALPAKWFTFPDYKSPFRDIYGFAEIIKEAGRVMEQNSNPRKALAVTNWTMGSRAIYYGLPYKKMKVFIIDQRNDQFDQWEKESPTGYDLLFINTYFHRTDVTQRFKCDSCRSESSMDIMLNGGKVDSIEYVWCKNYQGVKP